MRYEHGTYNGWTKDSPMKDKTDIGNQCVSGLKVGEQLLLYHTCIYNVRTFSSGAESEVPQYAVNGKVKVKVLSYSLQAWRIELIRVTTQSAHG